MTLRSKRDSLHDSNVMGGAPPRRRARPKKNGRNPLTPPAPSAVEREAMAFPGDLTKTVVAMSVRLPSTAAILGRSSALLAGVLALGACSSSQAVVARPVAAAPPPKDDGKPAQGGLGGSDHAAALEELKISSTQGRVDKQNSVRVPLPDAEHWTRVKFWGVPSLVGFRYGKDHHAIVAGFVTHVDDNQVVGACSKSFEAWATPWIEAFDVDLTHEPPSAFMWNRQIIDVDTLFAKTATLASTDSYATSYASFPVWGKTACLIVGVAVPTRDEDERAKEVRDRFAHEIFPKVEVLGNEEPKERY